MMTMRTLNIMLKERSAREIQLLVNPKEIPNKNPFQVEDRIRNFHG
jgi:hypothetical protein